MADGYVLVIGASGIDMKGRAISPLAKGTSIPGKVKSNSGGVARNVAENLIRLGQDIIFISAVGNDRSGDRIRSRLEEVGIDVNHIVISNEHRTAAYIALFDSQGTLLYSLDDMSVMDAITPQIIYRKRGLIHQADMIVLDSNLSDECISRIIKEAAAKDVPVVADPTSTLLAEKLIPYLSNLYMITPNASEAEILSGLKVRTRKQAVKAAQVLVGLGVDIALVTLAERGTIYATSDTNGHIPALTTNVVDLTGAADALTAVIIFGLLNEFPIDEAVRLGANAAALTLQSEDSVISNLNLDLLYNSEL